MRGKFLAPTKLVHRGFSRPSMESAKRKGGRPPHNPSEMTRRLVQVLAAQGTTQGQICSLLGISEKTLRVRYRKELDRGAARLEAALALRLFELAAGNGPTALKAIRFVLKSKFGWSEFAPPPGS